VRLALVLAAAVILIRDPTGKWAGDPLQPWFDSLRNKLGMYCCARADGYPVDDGEWDIENNKYRVFLDHQWTVVPDDAVILGPNKFGKAMVWYTLQGELETTPPPLNSRILCFMPGSGV
jgi:hypothetical protein